MNKLLLLVEESLSVSLASEIARLVEDLKREGWTVIRHDVSRNDTPENVKSVIRAEYLADPNNVKSVLLLGHIPVKRSGPMNPDGHGDRPFPADTFYGSMSEWSDNQTVIPSMELQVGRLDFSNLTCFSNKPNPRSEEDLTREYLNRNHAFRTGQLKPARQAFVCDNFFDHDYKYAAAARHSFPLLVGAENVVEVKPYEFLGHVTQNSYLFGYGCGGGGKTSCNGIGGSDDFATRDIKVTHLSLCGSYFIDWDNESNFMRAALGSGDCLTVCGSGVPYVYFHEMSQGLTIGECVRRSMNGDYQPRGW